MAESNIEWTDFTWNPWREKRYGQDPTQVVRASDKTFYAPLKLKEPQRVFTCSWSDFFIEEADAWRDEAFAIMALTPHITYQVLTKRPDRMKRNYGIYGQWPLPNVWLGVSVEDQKTAYERIPLLIETPHKEENNNDTN